MNAPVRTTNILICALGGEGGGVLAEWIVDCALRAGLPAQSTSVPGVAQRTGATSYYIELLPRPAPEGLQPVFALVPSAGRVDVLISSELLETARILERGFSSPARTCLITSSSRVYTTMEKMQMGDGRFDGERIHEAARALSKTYHALDLEKLAADNGTIVSATMFGAMAGAGAFPWPRALCEEAIKAGARGAQASLKGFDAAFAAIAGDGAPKPQAAAAERAPATDGLPAEFAQLPAGVREIVGHGLARVKDFQDEEYGSLFLERMRRLAGSAGDGADARIAHALEEAARRLALWMAYEDIPRVADLKTRKARFARIRAEAEMQAGQILLVSEYLKPGAEELADMLPAAIGRTIMRRLETGKSLPFLGRGLQLSTTGIAGHFAMRALARMRTWRRRSLRYGLEQEAIDLWLAAMRTSLSRAPDFAGALAELPRLRKGYGETQLRGKRNYAAVFDGLVAPAIKGGTESLQAPRLRRAISAALADPDGDALGKALAEREGPAAALPYGAE